MATTSFGFGDAKAVQRFSVALAAETFQKSFWGRNFMATDGGMPLHRVTELEKQAGDQVSVDLFSNLTSLGIEGESTLKGSEEALSAYTQNFYIDQLRTGVSLGGRMTRKRTVHELRSIGKSKLADWWARRYDEECFTYMGGGRGDETGDWLLPTTYTGRANNTVTAVVAAKKIYAGAAANDNAVGAADNLMNVAALEKINYEIKSMASPPKPIMVNGQERYVLILHPKAENDLRTATSAGDWAQLKKYSEQGLKEVFGEALGEWGKLMLYSSPKIPVNNNATPLGVCYNLVLGAQAGFIAHGDGGGGMQYSWHEEVDDRGDKPVIDTGSIFGVQRAIWNSVDFSTLVVGSSFGVAAS